jgi:FtsZ-binding cell division protein ZapB
MKDNTDVCKTCRGSGAIKGRGSRDAFAEERDFPCPTCTGQKVEGEFVKDLRLLTTLVEQHLSDNKLGRLYKKVKQACDLIEKLEGEKDNLKYEVNQWVLEVKQLQSDLAAAKSKIAELQKTNDDFLKMTSSLDEHPEGYEGPCLCRLCMSYGG